MLANPVFLPGRAGLDLIQPRGGISRKDLTPGQAGSEAFPSFLWSVGLDGPEEELDGKDFTTTLSWRGPPRPIRPRRL